MSNNRPDNQADWLGKLLDQFDPIDISHPDFERLKPQAHKIITTKIAEERIDELNKMDYELYNDGGVADAEVMEAHIKRRIAELEAGLKGGK